MKYCNYLVQASGVPQLTRLGSLWERQREQEIMEPITDATAAYQPLHETVSARLKRKESHTCFCKWAVRAQNDTKQTIGAKRYKPTPQANSPDCHRQAARNTPDEGTFLQWLCEGMEWPETGVFVWTE